MKQYSVIHLSSAALADTVYLRHPQSADWDEYNATGTVVDAASLKGLRLECSACGSIVESVDSASSSGGSFRCPVCDEKLFYVYVFSKAKSAAAVKPTKSKARHPKSKPGATSAPRFTTPTPSPVRPVYAVPPSSPAPVPSSAYPKDGLSMEDFFYLVGFLLVVCYCFWSLCTILYPPPKYYIKYLLGFEDAAYEMARSYINGEGWLQSEDAYEGWKVMEKYAAKGDASCAEALAIRCSLKGDAAQAAAWYEKAQSWSDARDAYIKSAEKCSSDFMKQEYYRKAVDVGRKAYNDPESLSEKGEAAYKVGSIYESLYDVKGDYDRSLLENALLWYEKASSHGYDSARRDSIKQELYGR